MSKRSASPKNDPLTGEKFIPKRSNQKFANSANKTAYNNTKARLKVKEKKPILDIIGRNEKILSWILGTEKERIVTKEFLLRAGFRLEYFTGTIFYNHRSYNRVYNFGFFAAVKDNFIISRLQ
jgi:hypothetical protein